jgi:uncharacterized membrane protein YeaQ/YmgE (transglycosylase-associated protein family)
MLIIGLLVGAVAKLLMPGPDVGGMLLTMVLGVAGAVLAGLIGRAAGWYEAGESAGFIAAVIGAVVILALFRWLSVARRRPPGRR